MDHEKFLSTAAKQFEESAIRRTGALAGRVPDLISFLCEVTYLRAVSSFLHQRSQA
jgi:hypothetical protein